MVTILKETVGETGSSREDEPCLQSPFSAPHPHLTPRCPEVKENEALSSVHSVICHPCHSGSLPTCPWLAASCDKSGQKQLVGEGFLFLTLPDHCPTLREASQELKAGAWETG